MTTRNLPKSAHGKDAMGSVAVPAKRRRRERNRDHEPTPCVQMHKRETPAQRKYRLQERRYAQDTRVSSVTTRHVRGMKARRDLTMREMNLGKYIPAGEFKNTQDRPKHLQRRYGGKLIGVIDPTVKPKRRSPTSRMFDTSSDPLFDTSNDPSIVTGRFDARNPAHSNAPKTGAKIKRSTRRKVDK